MVGGLEKLYMISYSDLSGQTPYTATSGGVISNISLVSGKKYVEVGLLKSTAGIKEVMTKNPQDGTLYFTQSLTVVIADVNATNKAWVESVQNQPVSVLVKSRTGKYFVLGLNGQLEMNSLEGGLGTAESDLVGYTIGFEGVSTKLIPIVDDTLIASLI
ncbi:hypothetical protein GCM10023184_14790 [Flaviaesturariibacter amylovorans]|uniref:Uncharacterized protein n=1 Tax=Flaviaesturariibacter amylovorans TaxID=1084520 RepID=A0ABP8GKU6_9BACT